MSKKKNQHGATFRAKVALAALKESHTVPQIAGQFQIHPNLVYKWRRQLVDGAATVFEGSHAPLGTEAQQAEIASLYELIGRLNVQLEWLKKNG
jgi:transposase-like protein